MVVIMSLAGDKYNQALVIIAHIHWCSLQIVNGRPNELHTMMMIIHEETARYTKQWFTGACNAC